MIGGTPDISTALATQAVLRDIAGHLSAAGGMADVDGIAQIKVFNYGGRVGGVVVEVVTLRHLARPIVAATIDPHHQLTVV